MVVLGIDPGLETVGFGVVRREGSRLTAIDHGAIVTPRVAIGDRLRQIHEEVSALIDRHDPAALAVERQIFAANKTTALDVAKALGVVLLAAAERGLEAREYAPPEVKLAVVGHGGAEKRQVQYMVAKLLGLEGPPRPDDAADALAIAIAHALRAPLAARIE
jgi:crossover junction endodeoxyribonuclease RuvC